MVFVFSPYILKYSSYSQFQVSSTFNDFTAQHMSKLSCVANLSLKYHFWPKSQDTVVPCIYRAWVSVVFSQSAFVSLTQVYMLKKTKRFTFQGPICEPKNGILLYI